MLHGEGEGPLTIVADGQTHAGNTRCVHHGEVVPGADGHLVLDLDLPAQVHQERAVRDVDDPYPGDVTEAGDDLLAMDAVPGLDRDVPDDPITQGLDEIHRPDVPARVTDRRSHPPQHPGPVLDLHTEGDAVARAGSDGHGRPYTPAGTMVML